MIECKILQIKEKYGTINIVIFVYDNKLGILAEKVGEASLKMTQKSRKVSLILTMMLLLIVTLSSTIPVQASGFNDKSKIPIPQVQENVYVYDQDNILDDETEQKLNTLLVELERQTTAEVVVITVDSLLDMEIEDYSYELANTLGIGKAEEDNGVLLLISRNDEKVRLEIGKGLEGCLNDSKCGRILDNYFVPYREEDKYSEGTYKTIQAVVSVVAEEYEVTIDGSDEEIAKEFKQQEEDYNRKVLIIVIVVIILLILFFVCDLTFFDGELSSAVFAVGGSSSGGGSFGGGSFGGGGASR